MHYLIKDTDFENILKFLMTIKRIHIKNIDKLRIFLEAIFYMSKAGCCWRLLPFYYGNYRAVHKRFSSWQKQRIWENMFEAAKNEPDMEWIMIDSTIVRAHACAAGYGKDSQEREALGRSKGGFTTKIHALVDALGNPLKFILTPGQKHDITQAKALVHNLTSTTLIADAGYDATHFVQLLEEQQCDSEIPSRKNRKEPRILDDYLYAERHVVECFFGKIKHFRRIFSRYDKSARSYLSFLYFVGTLIWLR
jgi:transposase